MAAADLVWVLIRQDDGANRYRVGRYATRAEAERVAEALDGRRRDPQPLYVIERLGQRTAHPA
jgi:hypothetical protein